MKINNIIMGVIALTLGAIMVSGALLPSVASAVFISGDPVTYTNETNTLVNYRYDYLDSVEYTITTESNNNYSIVFNGQTINRVADNFPIYFSDVGFSEAYGTSLNNTADVHLWGSEFEDSLSIFMTTTTVGTTTVVFENGLCTVTSYDGTTRSMPYNWVMGIVPDGEYISYNGQINDLYVKNINDFAIYSGNYQTGENDTYYAFAMGELYVQDPYKDVSTFSYTGETLVDGTLDIYTGGNAVIHVGEESFTPYRCIVKEKITGVSDDSPIQAMIATIPIIAIAGLVMAGIYVFISRK